MTRPTPATPPETTARMGANGDAVSELTVDRWAAMPKAPEGFTTCRVGHSPQVTHLVMLDSKGSNGGRPTMCRLTRFDTRDPETREVLLPADLPGWSMGGGVSGPGVEQVECPDCYARATATLDARRGRETDPEDS